LINIQPFKQGEEYNLTITDATAENGTHLAESRSFIVTTPPALRLSETTPGKSRLRRIG
jgi:predicted RNA-binding protein with TRAM domain